MGSMILAIDLCVVPTPGSSVRGRDRDQRLGAGTGPVVSRGIAFPLAPQHPQPPQRPSAPRPRIR